MRLARSRWFAWLLVFAWYAALTWLSNQPSLPGPKTFPRDYLWFKSAHILAYGFLATLLWHAWRLTQTHWRRTRLWGGLSRLEGAVVVNLGLLASIDEIHQSFVPGRHPRVTDIAIDLIATLLVLWFLRRYNAVRNGLGQAVRQTFGM